MTDEPLPDASPPADEELLCLKPGEVARLYGVTPRTVANWCDKGIFEFVETPGGHRRVLVPVSRVAHVQGARAAARRSYSRPGEASSD